MKKYSRLAIALVAGFCILQAGQAWAGIATMQDSNDPDDTRCFDSFCSVPGIADKPSNPELLGVVVEYDQYTGELLHIMIESATKLDDISFATLYINNDATTGGGENWKYIVHTGGNTNEDWGTGSVPVKDGLYAVSNPSDYTLVDNPDGREGHPNGISADNNNLTWIADVGWSIQDNVDGQYVTDGYILTYNFTGLSIDLAAVIEIAWTPYSADGVLYVVPKRGPLDEAPAVPEPVTMALFGLGMAALTGWRMQRSKAKDK